MTDERLAELWKLADAATPGPWEAYGPTRGEGLTFTNEAHVGPSDDNDCIGPIAAVSGDDRQGALTNAKLIAAARTAIPELLNEIARLRAMLSRVT